MLKRFELATFDLLASDSAPLDIVFMTPASRSRQRGWRQLPSRAGSGLSPMNGALYVSRDNTAVDGAAPSGALYRIGLPLN